MHAFIIMHVVYSIPKFKALKPCLLVLFAWDIDLIKFSNNQKHVNDVNTAGLITLFMHM